MNDHHRKASARVRVLLPDGRPAAGARVDYTLAVPEFLFGSGAFDSLPATAEGTPGNIDFYQDSVAPDREFSQGENRKLAQRAEFSLSALAEGKFFDDLGSYLADQFPGRDLQPGNQDPIRQEVVR